MPKNANFVRADVVDLYPSIPHEVGLSAMGEALEKETRKPFLWKNY